MGTLERAAKAAAARKISRRLLLKEHKMPETTVPVSLRDAFLEDPFFRTGWDEMNSEYREMRSFASKEGDNTMANVDRGWPWLPKQWMLPQLLQDFHLPEMKDSPVQPQVRDATECEERRHCLQPQPRWGDGDHDAQGAEDRGGGERGYTDPD